MEVGDASVQNLLAHSRHVEKESAYEGTGKDVTQKMEGIFFSIPAQMRCNLDS
jgi:hypothetical protein